MMIYSCSSDADEFIGSWEKEYEDEVDGWGFCHHYETLTLNDDNSFTQSWSYLDGTKTDTIARASISGNWEVNDSCLEMEYDQTTLNASSVVFENEPIFFNVVLAKTSLANEQLKSAHDEDSTFGVKKVMVKEDKIISNGDSATNQPIEIYSRKKQ